MSQHRLVAFLTLLLAFAFAGAAIPAHAEQAVVLEPRVFAALVLGVGDPAAPAPPAGVTPEWLARVNAYRALANLPPVSENPAWSAGAYEHSRYVVKNNEIAHNQDPAKPYATPAGAEAGRNSNVMAHSSLNTSDSAAIDSWMQAPFHALGMIDPRLARSGFGSYREADGGFQMAATLDIVRGIDWSRAASTSYPVIWPANGTVLPFVAYRGGEWPDPLTSCAGYTVPSGAPLYVQFGSGSITPVVSASSLTRAGQPLEHCVYTETSYTNPDGTSQSLARSILGSRDAVVVIPRAPLVAGAAYTVSLTVNGVQTSWSFTVAPNAKDGAGAAVEVAEEAGVLAEPLAE
jgi:hypothetical protein